MFEPNSILGKLLLRHTDRLDDPSVAAAKLLCEVNETICSLRDWKRQQDEEEADFEKSLQTAKLTSVEDEPELEVPQADMLELNIDRFRSLRLPIVNVSENRLSEFPVQNFSEIETSDLYQLGNDLTKKLTAWQFELDDLLQTPCERSGGVWNQLDEIEKELAELEAVCGGILGEDAGSNMLE